MAPWYEDAVTDRGFIISARVRLARNVKKYPFRAKLTEQLAKEMVAETTASITEGRTIWANSFMNISDYSEIDNKMFIEKHIISPEFAANKQPKGLLLQEEENISIMLNEEDHIRIQTLAPGDSLVKCWESANHIDNLIEETIEFAFDKNYGYLTACPTNAGTGLRASYMIHLPLLEKSGQLKNMLPAIGKFGIAIRGLYGEGTESMGNIFQVSNQVTLGKSEEEIIEGLQNVAQNVIEKEQALRDKAMQTHRLDIENNIHRSYGILKYSRKTNLKEAMNMLSEIRLGRAMGLFYYPSPKSLYQVMMEIQPGHIQRKAGETMDETALDVARADYLRDIFKEEYL